MKKYFFRCLEVAKDEIKTFSTVAKDIFEAEKKMQQNKNIIVLSYEGWEEVKPE